MDDTVFSWAAEPRFIGRHDELARLEAWWAAPDAEPINLYGRRRVGKSWLLRRFAHGKVATVLVAARSSEGTQLRAFAERLEPLLGVRPDIGDVAGLVRTLYRAARGRRLLAVIDEFPWLLPGNERGDTEVLSAIASVMEDERDDSQLKLVLCGSYVQQMEAMMAERSPLHGRLTAMHLRPVPFEQAALYMPGLDPRVQFERFAIAGGMPRYLSELGRGSVRAAVSNHVLDRDAPLWDEARVVLDQELRDSRNYFAIACAMAGGPVDQGEIAQRAALPASTVSKYLQTLSGLRITSRTAPLAAHPDARNGRWSLDDPFFRFWFRFVFPYQDDLENGLAASDLFDAEVAPHLASHVAPEFERWCREWARRTYGSTATRVGSWWGRSLDGLRRSGARSTEEVDIVGTKGGRVTLVGEVKWRTTAVDANVLRDIEDFRVPAMRQAGLRMAANPTIVIVSKGGYTPSLLRAAAEADGHIVLPDVAEILAHSRQGAQAVQ